MQVSGGEVLVASSGRVGISAITWRQAASTKTLLLEIIIAHLHGDSENESVKLQILNAISRDAR